MLDTLTLKQIQDNPIPVVCQQCKWSGDLRECPTEPVGFLTCSGEVEYEKEPVCPVCRSPNFD